MERKVEDGFNWKNLRPLLRINIEEAQTIETLRDIPFELRIHYMRTYNLIYKKITRDSQKDSDPNESLKRWGETLSAEGYFVVHRNLDLFPGTFIFGWSSPWQRGIMNTHQDIACLDATHDTCVSPTTLEKCLLITIVVKHKVSGKGIPVAFLITNKGNR